VEEFQRHQGPSSKNLNQIKPFEGKSYLVSEKSLKVLLVGITHTQKKESETKRLKK